MPFWWYYSVGGGGEEENGRPDLAWVTSHLPINLALSEVIIRNVLRATAAGGNMHGRRSHSRCGGIVCESNDRWSRSIRIILLLSETDNCHELVGAQV